MILLLYLFLQSAQDLNNFRALGFMMLFSFWSISEKLYRKTVKILIFFASFFILTQYYYSLNYQKYYKKDQKDTYQLNRFRFFNIYDKRMHYWAEDEVQSIYFRFKPYPYDWAILIISGFLISINKLYTNEKEAEKLEKIAYDFIKENYQTGLYIFMQVKNKAKNYFIYCLSIGMIYFIGKAQTNIINICFFSLIVANGMLLAKNDDKRSTIKWIIVVTKIINTLAMVVIIGEFFFSITLGYRESLFKDSMDQRF